MADDGELLRRYADEGREDAFAELVRRHLAVVYAAARRQVRESGQAEDIVQAVFADLARKARALRSRPVLLNWLYTAVHHAAANTRRAEWRRRVREGAVLAMQAREGVAIDAEWERLWPALDEAMHRLGDEDREALLLRFFQGLTLSEVARPLRISEEAARKRIDRALEKLRAILARRGITSTAAALASTLAAQPAVELPAGLLAASTLAGTSTVGAGGAAAAILFMSSFKIVAGVAAIAAAAAVFMWNRPGGAAAGPPPSRREATLQRMQSFEQIVAAMGVAGLSSKAPAPTPAGPDPEAGLVKLHDFRNRGRSTPSYALQTALWASATPGQEQVLADTIHFEGPPGRAQELWLTLDEDIRARAGSPERLYAFWFASDTVDFLDLVRIGEVSFPDPTRAKLPMTWTMVPANERIPGRVHDKSWELVNIAGEWKLILPMAALEHFIGEMRSPSPDSVYFKKTSLP